VLAFVGVVGFALGAYGAGRGSAQDTLSTLTTTGPLTTTATITESSTTIVTTTAPAPTTTSTPATTTAQTTTSGTVPLSETSSSSTPWGWIALGLGIAALLLIGLLLWRRNRAGTASWQARAADLNRRCLVALDDVLLKGSVVTGQVEALAADARSLAANAPDDASKASSTEVHARLEELAEALDADRRLRLGSPPPSAEQLAYSTSVIRQQVKQLQDSRRQQRAAPKP
jgi:hypothetical protein